MPRLWTTPRGGRKCLSVICVTCLVLATYELTYVHHDSKQRTMELRSYRANEISSDYREADRTHSRENMNVNKRFKKGERKKTDRYSGHKSNDANEISRNYREEADRKYDRGTMNVNTGVKKGEREKTDRSMMRTVSIGNYWPYGIVSTVRPIHEHVHRILDDHAEVKTQRDRLLELLKPALDGSQKKMILEQFYALVAVLWGRCSNEPATVFTRENITLSETYAYNPKQQGERQRIDCGNIHQVNNVIRLGSGSYKDVYKGDYMGKEVVIKADKYRDFDPAFPAPNGCKSNFTSYIQSPVAVLTEVFLRQFLTHPSLAKIYGHCIHDGIKISGIFFPPGVITVHQYATQAGPYKNNTIGTLLRYSVQVADLLRYAENSPLGRLILRDFGQKQFLLVESRITLVDYHKIDSLDDCSSKEPSDIGECHYNFKRANFVFFHYLLRKKRYPTKMRPFVGNIHRAIKSYSVNARRLHESLRKLYMYYRRHYHHL